MRFAFASHIVMRPHCGRVRSVFAGEVVVTEPGYHATPHSMIVCRPEAVVSGRD